jgi:hypothetical protein
MGGQRRRGKRANGWAEEEREKSEWVGRGRGGKERRGWQRRRGKREKLPFKLVKINRHRHDQDCAFIGILNNLLRGGHPVIRVAGEHPMLPKNYVEIYIIC